MCITGKVVNPTSCIDIVSGCLCGVMCHTSLLLRPRLRCDTLLQLQCVLVVYFFSYHLSDLPCSISFSHYFLQFSSNFVHFFFHALKCCSSSRTLCCFLCSLFIYISSSCTSHCLISAASSSSCFNLAPNLSVILMNNHTVLFKIQ